MPLEKKNPREWHYKTSQEMEFFALFEKKSLKVLT